MNPVGFNAAPGRQRQAVVASSAQTGQWIDTTESVARESFAGRLTNHWFFRVLIAAAGWTAVGVIFALPSLGTSRWDTELRIYLSQWWMWGLLTPVIMVVDRRLPFSGKELGRRVAVHLALNVVFTEPRARR